MKTKKERPVRTGVCSMIITINGFEYAVRPHSWNGAYKVFVLTKQTEDKPVYKVGVGSYHFCNCPDNTKNKPEGGCKHIKALRALWLI